MPSDTFPSVRPGVLPSAAAVAPDALTLRAGRALLDKPFRFGRDAGLTWAEFAEPRRVAREAFIDDDFDAGCTCGAARFPCRHLLALLDRAGSGEPPSVALSPSWVRERSAKRLQPSLFSGYGLLLPDESHLLETTRAGLRELEKWLSDLLDQGLARLPAADRSLWNAAADRLVDAYMPDLAAEVRDLALIPGSGRDWPERLLPRLGHLQLLCEGFKRYETLPAAVQGDLRWAAGWTELPPGEGDRLADRWRVLGIRQVMIQKRRRRRTWLFGLESGRFALVESVTPERQHEDILLPVDWSIEGTLLFHPSATPLRATFVSRGRVEPLSPTDHAPLPLVGIEAAASAASAMKAANPWRRDWPMGLGAVRLEPVGGWRVRDRKGACLPLDDRFGLGWTLLSLGAGGPFDLFGEWDGERFSPLSAAQPGGGWRSLEPWKSVT